MTPRERNMLADIKRSLVRIYEYCETRSTYSDGERDQWEHVSMIAKDVIRETTILEAVGEECNAALAAPRKNGDVGTPQEQIARHQNYCGNGSGNIRCINDSLANCKQCFEKWKQMPYQGGEGK